MSETPRTDAEFKLEAFFDGTGIVETVLVEFAQELESELADKDRQLTEARAEIERLKQLWSCNLDIIGGELNKQLAEAKTEIERLKSEHEESLRRAKDNAVSLSSTVTEYAGELLAKDRLIEQMRKALAKLIGTLEVMSVMPETLGKCPVLAIDAPELEQARAALAAEGDE